MNRTGNFHDSERGQAIILIVLTVVGLVGFAALAIDAGQIYYARRSAQAAADAAALAAAFDATAGSKVRATAMNRAVQLADTNGFKNDENVTVEVYNPPQSGPYQNAPEKEEYYQVKITVTTKPVFAQVVFAGAEKTTVEAIARAKGIAPVSGSDALLALSKEDDAFEFDGTTSVTVTGGNIRSNGKMIKNGHSGVINVPLPGNVFYGTGFRGDTYPFTPSTAKPQPAPATTLGSYNEPYCPSAADRASWDWHGSGKYYSRAIDGVNYYYYPQGLSVENLPPGIHCVDGGIGKGNYTGAGVLIVLLSGDIKQTGGDSLDFRAAANLIDKNGNQFGGLVFYAPPSNTSVLQLGGNSDAYLEGTFLAPGATCKIGGNPDGQAYHSAFVCDKIKIHGNPIFQVVYQAEQQLRLKAMVELTQ